uniref:Helix-turn-helix domain-containing protein n=1 Tax=Ralstonia solanacearum TaxID=305 RepID=A0A0S4UEC3_RALSL|nr:protein of unknown function [Ralstonia solanacearum]
MPTDTNPRTTENGAPADSALNIDQIRRAADDRLALTVDEAAACLGISRPTAYEGVRTGQIPSVRIGRRILVPRAALEQMLAGGSTGSAA